MQSNTLQQVAKVLCVNYVQCQPGTMHNSALIKIYDDNIPHCLPSVVQQ